MCMFIAANAEPSKKDLKSIVQNAGLNTAKHHGY